MSFPALLGRVTIATGVNDVIIIREGGGDITCTVAAGNYYLLGDGSSIDLLKAVTDALTASAGALTYTGVLLCSINVGDRCGYVTISAGSNFDLRWGSTSTTFDPSLLGFAASNTGAALQQDSTLNPSSLWIGNDHARALEPFSSRVASVTRAQSGAVRGVSRSDRMQSYRLSYQFLDEERVFVSRALAADAANSIEGFIETWGAGATFGLFEVDSETAGVVVYEDTDLVAVCAFSEDTLTTFDPRRAAPGTPLYGLDLTLHVEVD